MQLDFPIVSLSPSASFSPISEEWGELEVTAEVLADSTGSFGTAIWNITAEVDATAMTAQRRARSRNGTDHAVAA